MLQQRHRWPKIAEEKPNIVPKKALGTQDELSEVPRYTQALKGESQGESQTRTSEQNTVMAETFIQKQSYISFQINTKTMHAAISFSPVYSELIMS